MHFACHMRGGRKSKLESIVVTSTVGIDQCMPERVSRARGLIANDWGIVSAITKVCFGNRTGRARTETRVELRSGRWAGQRRGINDNSMTAVYLPAIFHFLFISLCHCRVEAKEHNPSRKLLEYHRWHSRQSE